MMIRIGWCEVSGGVERAEGGGRGSTCVLLTSNDPLILQCALLFLFSLVLASLFVSVTALGSFDVISSFVSVKV